VYPKLIPLIYSIYKDVILENTINAILPFENLDKSLQTQIDNQAKQITFKKGDMPFLSNEITQYIYVVKTGKIKSYQMNLDTGREQTLYIYRDNTIFDTATLLDGENHDVCYEVLEDTNLIMFSIEFIRNLLYNFPEFSQKFYLYIAKQMRHLEEMLTDISLYSTSERLIKLIVQDFQPNNIFKFNILDGLSHGETANLIGTVRHIVERHLKELKNENIINIKNRKIQILETNKLLQKINFLA
jgi:CRP-like cAMP-binding protein